MKRSSIRKFPFTEFPGRVPQAPNLTKRLIDDDNNSSSSPADSARTEAPNSGPATDTASTSPIEEVKLYGPVISNPHLNADDILDEILRDLNSKNNDERPVADTNELDNVSELTDGCAKSLMDEEMDGGDDESDCDETTDEDEDEAAHAMEVEQQSSVAVIAAEEKKWGPSVFSGSNNKVAPSSKEEQDMPLKNPAFNQRLNPRVSPDTTSSNDNGSSFENKETMDTATDGSGETYADSSNEDYTLIDSHSDGSEENRGLPKTNKATINMDVVIAKPGDPKRLTVRAMYCTPLVGNPDDIVIKVEVSLLFC